MARCLTFAAVIGLTVAVAAASNAQSAHLVMQSQPGDFIGQGQNWDITYTPADPGFFHTSASQPINGQPSYLEFVLGNVTGGSDNTFAILDFSTTQLGIPMQPGTYDNAERAPFASPGHPGLDVSFQNRGSNTLTGSFIVDDFSYNLDQATGQFTILKFDASFIQHSEGAAPALTGTFSYNAVPEPASMAALALGALGLLGRRRRKTP